MGVVPASSTTEMPSLSSSDGKPAGSAMSYVSCPLRRVLLPLVLIPAACCALTHVGVAPAPCDTKTCPTLPALPLRRMGEVVPARESPLLIEIPLSALSN